ncbi:MAG: N-acetylglucosamine-binding protein GbpA [Plesiomonas sp.]|uniref:N-acetylglucosamine-binding protein GbpA n=1 Tax=Plesiomonas sp. TaxID=2486279 RepID=UPI003F2BB979
MKLSQIVLLTLALLSTRAVLAHGSIQQPASRAYACHLGDNLNCSHSGSTFDYFSLEGIAGFPEQGVPDGQIASAGKEKFGALDIQTSTRWKKTPISAGNNTFRWVLTANHITHNFVYYITKQDWDQNAVLTRESFDLQPFCTVNSNMQQPAKISLHTCHVPARTGYQIILGVWNVGDTQHAFYNVIDVDFGGASEKTDSPWRDVGDINPTEDLNTGDEIKISVLNKQGGDQPDLSASFTIASEDQGKKDNWVFALASSINEKQTLYQVGRKNTEDKIIPVYGRNDIFVKKESDISSVVVDIAKTKTEQPLDVEFTGLKDKYAITDGSAQFDFTLHAIGDLTGDVRVYDHNNNLKWMMPFKLNNTTQPINVDVKKVTEGRYKVVAVAHDKENNSVQQNSNITLTNEASIGEGDYDFIFPDSLAAYTEGTKVLQPKNGKIYICKPFPESGYCIQWSESTPQYEPGVGESWQDAWVEQ